MEFEYNPAIRTNRRHLAACLLVMLANSGFVEMATTNTKERVFYRMVEGTKIRVMVYTTIVGQGDDAEVRCIGKDAIRVCGVYRDSAKKDRGVAKETRINRTGTVEAIVDRVLQRMRKVYVISRDLPKCQCGAPMFTSSKGNPCCADLCWKQTRSNGMLSL